MKCLVAMFGCVVVLAALTVRKLPAASAEPAVPGPGANGWTELFNGRDLTGWETSLGVPTGGKEPIGRNRDPRQVFQVVQVDSEPAIHISGEVYGSLVTLQEYGNYHLELEFKWGQRRFLPWVDLPRNSGLLYHGTGNYDPSTGWLEALEFGILEGGETGDSWSTPCMAGVSIQVDVEGEDIPLRKRRYPNETYPQYEQPIKYRPGGKKYTGVTVGILNSDDNEKPRGQWNKLELICLGQTSYHIVNGAVNMVLTNARRRVDGREEGQTRGRLQLQSEGAEIYFRRIRLRPIRKIPLEYEQALNEPPPNTLTAAEQAAGWRLLFDGQTTRGWRGYRRQHVSDGWLVRDGSLTRVAQAGDLITTETFGDFELVLDWKISQGGNSGIFYRATEAGKIIDESGPEYEIRDDNAVGRGDPYITGANNGLHPPCRDATRRVGYWNRTRIVVQKNHVEHYLNGKQVVSYELGSPTWQELVQASKARKWPRYGQAPVGHIGLQDRGDLVWFRNIKIRPLREK